MRGEQDCERECGDVSTHRPLRLQLIWMGTLDSYSGVSSLGSRAQLTGISHFRLPNRVEYTPASFLLNLENGSGVAANVGTAGPDRGTRPDGSQEGAQWDRRIARTF